MLKAKARKLKYTVELGLKYTVHETFIEIFKINESRYITLFVVSGFIK